MRFEADEVPTVDSDGRPVAWRFVDTTEPRPSCGRCGVEWLVWDYAGVWPWPAAAKRGRDLLHAALFVPHCRCWQLGTSWGIQAAAARGAV